MTKRQGKRRRLLGAGDGWAHGRNGEVGEREGMAHLGLEAALMFLGGGRRDRRQQSLLDCYSQQHLNGEDPSLQPGNTSGSGILGRIGQ